MNQQNIQNS